MKHILTLFFGSLILSVVIYACMSNPIDYPENKLYENTTDTASLVVKITNTNKLSVKPSKDAIQLLMFDSENLFLSQQTLPPVTNQDTTFTLKGLNMGHYSLLLFSKVTGLENLNYLVEGEHSYQNVIDTLQYLLAEGYLAVNEKVVVNNPVNQTTVNWQTTTSLIAQVKFNVRTLQNDDRWKNPSTNAKLHLLTFQNGTLCDTKLLSDKDLEAIKTEGQFIYPIAKGANYTFMVVDLNDYTDIGNVAEKLKNGKTTMDSVQIMLQTKIDEIRMAYKPQPQNFTKAEETVLFGNAIQSVDIKLQGATTPSWTTDATGWSLMIFDGSEYLKRVVSKDGKMTTADFWKINVFKDATYTLLAIGNAQSAVGEFQAMKIKAQYVLDNLQDKQSLALSWLGYRTGKITQLLNPSYLLTPEKRLKFSVLPILSIKDAKTYKALNYFANNPTRITGVVTNNGRTAKSGVEGSGLDNPISKLVILQDLSSVTDGEAILIEFKNSPTDLNIGDQITLALQDGEFTSSNPNASNMMVFQKVTYTQVGTKTTGINLPAKPLSLSEFTQTNYIRYEGMLIRVNENVEFKWFKDVQFNTYPSEKMILRDASVPATALLPSSRKTVNMQISNQATPTFAGRLLPAGKGNITGFLVRTKSAGTFAIHPRGLSDVDISTTLLDRVEKGVVGAWYDGVIAGNKSGFTTNVGIASIDKTNTNISTGGGYNSNYFYTEYGLKTTGFHGDATGKFLLIKLNTLEMLKGENLQIAISGQRDGNGLAWDPTTVSFKVQSSIDNGVTFIDVPSSNFNITAARYSKTAFNLPKTVISGVGGYEQAQIRIICTTGGTDAISVDYNIWWNNITITQFTE